MASFILPIVSGLAGLFGGQPKQQQQTNTTNTSSSGNFNQSNTPQLSPQQQQLADLFSGFAANRFSKDQDLSGYTAGGLENINHAADLKSKVMANLLAAKGQSFSPAAAFSQVQPENERLNQSTQFLNNVPMVQRQFQEEDFNNLLKSFGILPTATSTSGSSSQTGESNQRGTQITSGNPVAGALSGFGAGFAAPSSNGPGSNLDRIMQLFGLGSQPGGKGSGGFYGGTGN